jgi:hypothetical protein
VNETKYGGIDMRKAVELCAVIAVLGFLPDRAAEAAARGGQGWTVLTGETVGTNVTAVHVQAGWPGISASLLHGYTPTVDLGGIFSFNYGYEGDTNVVHPGLKLQGYGKATLLDDPKYNLAVWFAPGVLTYFFGSTCYYPGFCTGVGTIFGLAFPTGLIFGLPVTNVVNIAFNFDLPLFVTFGDFGSFTVPILFGGGVEYFLEKNMALTFNLRAGPMIFAKSGYGTDFALQALFGLAFKL